MDNATVPVSTNYTFTSLQAPHTISVRYAPFINLTAGWNMVSFPYIPVNNSFANLLNGVGYYRVLTWNGTGYIVPLTAEAGCAYWVFLRQNVTLSIRGVSVDTCTRTLPAGWSMIGSTSAEQISASPIITGSFQLATWNTTYTPQTSFSIGKGYWIFVPSEQTIVW